MAHEIFANKKVDQSHKAGTWKEFDLFLEWQLEWEISNVISFG